MTEHNTSATTTNMPVITPAQLNALIASDYTYALIDVRESGEYNSSHIPGSSLIPRRDLETQMAAAVPHRGIRVALCDDDGRRAALAANTLRRMGYLNVRILEGGMNQWVVEKFPTEWGVNVPSKDFGEKMQVHHHVPEISATELNQRIENGDKLVILDTRTPEEYQRACIPGGRSVPGGELSFRITDITSQLDDDTTLIVNCAGRTRSIIGTRVLQRMGLTNVYGLENGTAGWALAGLELETGGDRVELPELSPDGIAAAEEYADTLASEDGVRFLDIPGLYRLMGRRPKENIYFIDVRTEAEYESGHIPGFRWFPGGQAVQRSDEVGVVHNCPIVFTCDGKARAIQTASMFRQMGHREVYVVQGGTSAWVAAGAELEPGAPSHAPEGFGEAVLQAKHISAKELESDSQITKIFVDPSQSFARGHAPGAHWIPRGWLELRIESVAPDKSAPMAVICEDGVQSTLAAATLSELGYSDVSVLNGGMTAWLESGIPVERGLSGVMSVPTDVLPMGPDRNFADMVNYLRWEEELGHKYETR
ncbi:MAG: rhodanese-like domain-containing protein [SAR202 cluster bacterium]|jgi:rhodanese-related sulfurtransferase|nr:rhodanese-like domain-containing protein [SAR202 cluster bacterium]MDP6512710.1 rhodanese-like domain-containing protein [SAR202 cluster bacterium]MDP6714040.1 rhodanese-like domain-containing protein [SAR202 cluster bacterium]